MQRMDSADKPHAIVGTSVVSVQSCRTCRARWVGRRCWRIAMRTNAFAWSIVDRAQGRNCAYRSADVSDAVAPSGRYVLTLVQGSNHTLNRSPFGLIPSGIVLKKVWKLSNVCSIIKLQTPLSHRKGKGLVPQVGSQRRRAGSAVGVSAVVIFDLHGAYFHQRLSREDQKEDGTVWTKKHTKHSKTYCFR